MLRESIDRKQSPDLAPRRVTLEAWLLAASIGWCAVLGCCLAYVILISVLQADLLPMR